MGITLFPSMANLGMKKEYGIPKSNIGSIILQSSLFLMIQCDIAYVDMFGETWMQFNGEHAIHMACLIV